MYAIRSYYVYKRVPKAEEELQELRKSVRENEMVYGRFISTNEQVAVIIAEIGDDVFSQEFYNNILKTVKQSETDDITIHVRITSYNVCYTKVITCKVIYSNISILFDWLLQAIVEPQFLKILLCQNLV